MEISEMESRYFQENKWWVSRFDKYMANGYRFCIPEMFNQTLAIYKDKSLYLTKCNKYLKSMAKKEKWVNPRLLNFNLSCWEEAKGKSYICRYNGLYIGCIISDENIEYMDVARAVLAIDLTKNLYSRNLTRLQGNIRDLPVSFVISPRRVEVSYGIRKK